MLKLTKSLTRKERRRSQQFLKVDSENFDEVLTSLTEALQIVFFFFFAKPDFQRNARHFKDNLPRADLRVNASH